MNVKRICIFLALMLIAGSAFCKTIRSKKIKEFVISVIYDSDYKYYYVYVEDHNHYNVYCMNASKDKNEAIGWYENVGSSDLPMLRSLANYHGWSSYREVNGWTMYFR